MIFKRFNLLFLLLMTFFSNAAVGQESIAPSTLEEMAGDCVASMSQSAFVFVEQGKPEKAQELFTTINLLKSKYMSKDFENYLLEKSKLLEDAINSGDAERYKKQSYASLRSCTTIFSSFSQ